MLRLANLWPCLYLGFTSYGHDVPRELRVTSGKRQTKNDVMFRLSPSLRQAVVVGGSFFMCLTTVLRRDKSSHCSLWKV